MGIRCQGPDSWSVLVPVQVQVFGPAVYSARPLVAGQPIGATDVVERDSDLTKLSAGVLSSVDDAIGKVPRLGVSAGQALRAYRDCTGDSGTSVDEDVIDMLFSGLLKFCFIVSF